MDQRVAALWRMLETCLPTSRVNEEGDNKRMMYHRYMHHLIWQGCGVYAQLPLVPQLAWHDLVNMILSRNIRQVIDAGCGRGLFSACLMLHLSQRALAPGKEIGKIHLVAYDVRAMQDNEPAFCSTLILKRETEQEQVLKARYPSLLLLLWPPRNDPFAAWSLSTFQGEDGHDPRDYVETHVVADIRFFEALFKDWQVVQKWALHGTHEHVPSELFWFRRKTAREPVKPRCKL